MLIASLVDTTARHLSFSAITGHTLAPSAYNPWVPLNV